MMYGLRAAKALANYSWRYAEVSRASQCVAEKVLNVQEVENFVRLEPYIAIITPYIRGSLSEEQNFKGKAALKRNSKTVFVWEGRLFRKFSEGLANCPFCCRVPATDMIFSLR